MRRFARIVGILSLSCSSETFSAADPEVVSVEPDAGGRYIRTAPPRVAPVDDGRVTIRVESALGPVPNAVVIVNDADGRLLEQVLADERGVVRVRRAASVSVLEPGTITTVFGMPEVIVVPARRSAEATMDLTVTATTSLVDVAPELVVDVPCGVPVGPFSGCAGESSYDVYAFARAGDGSRIAGFGVLTDLPFEVGVAATHTVDVNRQDFVEHSLRVTSVPDGTRPGAFTLLPRRAGRSTGPLLAGQVQITDMGMLATTRVPNLDFVSYELSGTLELDAGPPQREIGFWSLVDSSSSEWTPHALAGFTADCAVNVADALHPAVAWQLTSDALGDAIEIEATWHTSESVRWLARAAPAYSGSVRLPELPDAARQSMPVGNAALEVRIEHVDASEARGFEEYLNQIEQRSEEWTAVEL